MQPKVSVIMPSLNVKRYIQECMDSVINQTLRDIEIICVDAGSTDGTLEVLEEYAARDQRITIIHSDKKSYGYQINLGFDAANGEYIGIVETDDYIEKNMYRTLSQIADKYMLDIVKADFKRFWGSGRSRSFQKVKIIHKRELYNTVLDPFNISDVFKSMKQPWTGIYRTSFLKEKCVRLNESPGASYQDNGLWWQIFTQTHRVMFVNQSFYRVRRDNPNSSVNSKDKVYCMCEEHDFIRDFLHRHPEFEARFVSFLPVYRMINYDFTLNRIAPEFRMAFLHRYAEDFRKIAAAGELDRSLYTAEQWKRIQEIMECPEYIYYLHYYKSNVDQIRKELECVKNSVSFRIGRAVTWLPRKLRGAVRCYQERGLIYTFDRLLVKIRLKSPERWDYAYYSSLSPKKYPKELKRWYKRVTGEELDLERPKTYNEKIQWMKLYDSTPLKTRLADKYLVRDWVKEKIGEEYLVPLLGAWDSFDDIDFDKLPKQFVLKANHGNGWNVIVRDKSTFDKEAARNKFNEWMHLNWAFMEGFELQYLNIPPKIIAEQYLENGNDDLYDYKVFCFNGKAESIMFLSERRRELKMAFYNLQWEKLPFVYSYPQNPDEIPKPTNLELMIRLAEKLAEGFPHVRVDFYVLNDGSIKFGEMTFSTDSGICKWNIPEQNRVYGDLITLPFKKPIPMKT